MQKRRDAGHSIRSLAEVLEVDHSVIAKFEAGRRKPDVFEYLRLCTAPAADPCEGLQLEKDRHSC